MCVCVCVCVCGLCVFYAVTLTLKIIDICAPLASSYLTFCALPHGEQYYRGMYNKRDLVTDMILKMSVTFN